MAVELHIAFVLDDCFSYMACVSRCLESLSACKGMLLCKKKRALASFASVFCLATTSPDTIEQVLAGLNVLPGNETSCTTKEPLCE